MARYGSQQTPFTEDMKPMPVDPYGIAKVAGEETLQVLAKLHGMEYNIAVPHNIVGPNQKYDDPYRNVVSIMINRNLQGQPSIIYGDGEQTRCFSYIDDVSYCLEKLALDPKIYSEIINVGPDESSCSINTLSSLVANSSGYNGKPIYVKERPQEVKHATCSADKARQHLEYETKTTLEESIKKTVEYIRTRGTRSFKYNLPLEIINDKTPETWKKKLI
jgi:UDP-glucose 4-epimerase